MTRRRYLADRRCVVLVQGAVRRWAARKKLKKLKLKETSSVNWINYNNILYRRRYLADRRRVVLVQGAVRRWAARKKLKKLKIEAKSVEHQKQLNKGTYVSFLEIVAVPARFFVRILGVDKCRCELVEVFFLVLLTLW
jgi:myosin V